MGVDVMARPLRSRAAWFAIVAAAFAMAASCGDDPTPTRHPDTGIGAGETPPAVANCLDLCLRSSYCVGQLCDEDKMSTAYGAIADQLALQCATQCGPAVAVPGDSTPASWQCLFQSSCRQVFEEDVCGVKARYSCQ
jgi:hypothetical protein